MSRSPWAARRQRAARLLREAPHAEELLVFYIRLTEIQERVAEDVPVEAWLAVMPHAEAGTSIRPERIPPVELLPKFDTFLRQTAEAGTDVITTEARALLDSEPSDRLALLAGREGFHARAFFEPVMTTLASAAPERPTPGAAGRCHRCGSRPVLGVLQDVPDALGARTLQCSLCATEWRVDRLQCAHCGETAADGLRIYTAESVPWVRVDECLACRHYIKSIDLRQRGDAVPVVDEVATVELDVWAGERGLTKIQSNVLGL